MRAARTALLLVLVAAPARLAAQLPSALGFRAGLARVHFASVGSGAAEALSGLLAAGQARLTLGRVSLAASYGQGRLLADTGGASPRDLVEGGVTVEARPLPWLRLGVGPHLRAYVASGGAERWVMWEARALVSAPLIPGVVEARLGAWVSAATSSNTRPGASDAHGAEAGLTARVPATPLWARLMYVVDRARLQQAARTETLESVVLSVGIGAR